MNSPGEPQSNSASDREIRKSSIINSITAVAAQLPTEIVPISSLVNGDSPRLSGHDSEHVHALTQTEAQLPPILVSRRTMQVIDGMHRVLAAMQRGDQEIEVCFFCGDEKAAFVLAVQANVTHGLPLTLADRTAAATRILVFYPDWSDREIARITGLAAPTVGAIRRRTTVNSAQLNSRLGRDGKVRPLTTAEGRRRAVQLIDKNPEASLREISKTAGISIGTARDVRRRLTEGRDPVPQRQLDAEQSSRPRKLASHIPNSDGRSPTRPPGVVLDRLRRDPSLRSTETGRELLHWLTMHVRNANRGTEFIDLLPPHSAILIAEAARGLAQTWSRFADDLAHHVASEPGSATE